MNIAALLGGIIGGPVVLLAVIFAVLCYCRYLGQNKVINKPETVEHICGVDYLLFVKAITDDIWANGKLFQEEKEKTQCSQET